MTDRLRKMMSAYKDLIFVVAVLSVAIAAAFGAAALVDWLFISGTIAHTVAMVLSGVLVAVLISIAIIYEYVID